MLLELLELMSDPGIMEKFLFENGLENYDQLCRMLMGMVRSFPHVQPRRERYRTDRFSKDAFIFNYHGLVS